MTIMSWTNEPILVKILRVHQAFPKNYIVRQFLNNQYF